MSVTVGRLREWLLSFEDDATVVVEAGVGYEEPRLTLAPVLPVTVPQRYVDAGGHDSAIVVIALRPVNRR